MTYDELVYALRHPSKKMLDAMGKAMSPARRPTEEFVPVREKHRIRFLAAVNALLGEEGTTSAGEPVVDALRACHSIMEFYTDMTPELEFHNEWRQALDRASEALTGN
jgi:hypothetical protein